MMRTEIFVTVDELNPDYLKFKVENHYRKTHKKIYFKKRKPITEFSIHVDFDKKAIWYHDLDMKLRYLSDVIPLPIKAQFTIFFIKNLEEGGDDGLVKVEFKTSFENTFTGNMYFIDLHTHEIRQIPHKIIVDFEKKSIEFLNAILFYDKPKSEQTLKIK